MSETSTNGAGDVVIDTTAQLDIGSAPGHLAPRGRIVLIAGAAKAERHLRSFYLREAQLLGFS